MLRAIVFDFDGIILESMDLKARVFRELFDDRPAEQDRIGRLYLETSGMTMDEQFRIVYREVLGRPVTEGERERLGREFRRRVAAEIACCPFVAGMPGFIERRSREASLFVVSGAPDADLRGILAQRRLDHLFRGIAGAARPKPELLSQILADHGWEPREAVFVGDSRYDCEAAAAVGVRFIGRVPAGRPNPFPPTVLAVVADLIDLEQRWSAILSRLA